MTEQGERGNALPALTITVAGVTVEMRPCGWLDIVEIPAAFDALVGAEIETPEQRAAFADGMVAFAHRIDAYAAGDILPSRIPPTSMQEFVVRWVGGVRDAAIPPAGASASRSPVSTSRGGARPLTSRTR